MTLRATLLAALLTALVAAGAVVTVDRLADHPTRPAARSRPAEERPDRREPAAVPPTPVQDPHPAGRPGHDPAPADVANPGLVTRPPDPGWQAQQLPPGTPGQPRGTVVPPRSVDQTDPDAVTTAVLATLWSHDTTLDTSPADAARRAARWLTPRYARLVAQPPSSGMGAQWHTWATRRAYTRVRVDQVTRVGTDTTTRVTRRARLTRTLHGDKGRATTLDPLTVTADLTRRGQHWRVARVDLDTTE
jgi:hypothetical protein